MRIFNSNPNAKYHYSVKVIDPAKKSNFEVKELQNWDKLWAIKDQVHLNWSEGHIWDYKEQAMNF